jgi:hypothetical protein
MATAFGSWASRAAATGEIKLAIGEGPRRLRKLSGHEAMAPPRQPGRLGSSFAVVAASRPQQRHGSCQARQSWDPADGVVIRLGIAV